MNLTCISFYCSDQSLSLHIQQINHHHKYKQHIYISDMKLVISEGAWIFEMETFDAPLSAEMILISKPLAVGIKWW